MNLIPDRFPEQKRPLVEAIISCMSISKFAKSIGVSRQTVDGWLYISKLAPPPKYCKKIEEATLGSITREQLRPDIFGEIDKKSLTPQQKLEKAIFMAKDALNDLSKARGKR